MLAGLHEAGTMVPSCLTPQGGGTRKLSLGDWELGVCAAVEGRNSIWRAQVCASKCLLTHLQNLPSLLRSWGVAKASQPCL